jgi:hypothetical protein
MIWADFPRLGLAHEINADVFGIRVDPEQRITKRTQGAAHRTGCEPSGTTQAAE